MALNTKCLYNNNINIDIAEYNAQNVVDVGDQQRPSDLSRPINLKPAYLTHAQNDRNTHITRRNERAHVCARAHTHTHTHTHIHYIHIYIHTM